MTVFELIEKLKEFDLAAEVLIEAETGSIYSDALVIGVHAEDGKVYIH